MKKIKFAFVLIMGISFSFNAFSTESWECGGDCRYTYTTAEDGHTVITIENGTTSIPSEAFEYFGDVDEVIIPDTVTSIGYSAFHTVTSLQSLTIPDSVISIGKGAFFNTKDLTSLIIGKNVSDIAIEAFFGMSNDAQIYCEGNTYAILQAKRKYYGLNDQELIPYTKDENGVYEVDGVFYSSSENMQAGISCGSQQDCLNEIKGGNQTSSDEPTHVARRIYTVEEATEAVSGKGKNTFTIRYR